MNEYFYLTANNEQRGPVAPEHFNLYGVKADTLVWCKGMADWKPAGTVDELKEYFRYGTRRDVPPEPPRSYNRDRERPFNGDTRRQTNLPCPDSHLTLAIIVTAISFFFGIMIGCIPGVVAIFKASKVNDYYVHGLYDQALLAADDAKRWVKYTIIVDVAIVLLLILAAVLLCGAFFTAAASLSHII